MRELIAIGIIVGPVALAILIYNVEEIASTLISAIGGLVLLSVIVAADIAGTHRYGWMPQIIVWDIIFAFIFCMFVVPMMPDGSHNS